MHTRNGIGLAAVVLVMGCAGGCKTGTSATTTPVEAPAEQATVAPVLSIGPEAGFSTPESVLFDPEADVYLVSNIVGSPVGKDGEAFISRVAPDGRVLELRWIDAATEGVELNAPKGLAFAGEHLCVADIDVVRVFDRHSGAPVGTIPVEGATFLNDVSVGPDGSIFVSDMGVTLTDEGFVPTGTDAVYRVQLGEAPEVVAKDPSLGGPNGLLALEDGVWVVTFRSGELYRILGDGTRDSVRRLPTGGLDGIVLLPGGDLLISSWEGSAIYRGPAEGEFEAVITDVPSPADIGYDPTRGRVLVPVFTENRVAIYEVR